VLRREAERFWRVDEMASEVRVTPAKAAAALAILNSNNLAAVSSEEPRSYRYFPATATLRAAVDNLEIAYNTRPVTLVRALYDRTAPIQSFADAFRLRKPEGGDR
jgi:hypothetical protein